MHVTKRLSNALYALALCAMSTAYSATGDTWFASDDGSITDVATGLEWQQNDDFEAHTQIEAVAYCQDLDLADQSDWRLPNIKELISIVDYRVSSPSMDRGAFTNPVESYYWSSSSRANSSSNAWVVDFSNGNVGFFAKSVDYYARCVR